MTCMIRDCTTPCESGWLFCTAHVDSFHLREEQRRPTATTPATEAPLRADDVHTRLRAILGYEDDPNWYAMPDGHAALQLLAEVATESAKREREERTPGIREGERARWAAALRTRAAQLEGEDANGTGPNDDKELSLFFWDMADALSNDNPDELDRMAERRRERATATDAEQRLIEAAKRWRKNRTKGHSGGDYTIDLLMKAVDDLEAT